MTTPAGTILIVDDNAANRNLLTVHLPEAGFFVPSIAKSPRSKEVIWKRLMPTGSGNLSGLRSMFLNSAANALRKNDRNLFLK